MLLEKEKGWQIQLMKLCKTGLLLMKKWYTGIEITALLTFIQQMFRKQCSFWQWVYNLQKIYCIPEVNNLLVTRSMNIKNTLKVKSWGSWLAQLVECVTLDIRVVNLSPMLGADYFYIITFFFFKVGSIEPNVGLDHDPGIRTWAEIKSTHSTNGNTQMPLHFPIVSIFMPAFLHGFWGFFISGITHFAKQ